MLSLSDTPTSFSDLRRGFKVNPNALSRQLTKLQDMNLIVNKYRKSEERDYSFYEITSKGLELLGKNIIFPLQMRLLERFKNIERQDWTWFYGTDLVKVEDKYHAFLVAGTRLPSLRDADYFQIFKKMSESPKTAFIDKNGNPCIVNAYTAWFLGRCPDRVSEFLKFLENKRLPEVAFYCLVFHRSTCLVYNNTDSVVFKEFEHFLRGAGLRLEPFRARGVD